MKKNKVLITGTSRGIGEALAIKFLNEGWEVNGFSRHKNDSIKKSFKKKGLYQETTGDLSNVKDVRRFLKKSIGEIESAEYEKIVLINNSGVLEPIKPIRESEIEEMIYNLKVNILGTASITNLFMSELKEISLQKIIINVSSGAGKNPYPSWGSYCASKAAIDMLTQCIQIEEKEYKNPCKIYSIAPGVVETQMQETIRSKSIEDFPLVNKFIELKETGKLVDAKVVAGKFFGFVEKEHEYKGNIIFNINDI
jgi:benzil reductase ((S)-benzoin forming)